MTRLGSWVWCIVLLCGWQAHARSQSESRIADPAILDVPLPPSVGDPFLANSGLVGSQKQPDGPVVVTPKRYVTITDNGYIVALPPAPPVINPDAPEFVLDDDCAGCQRKFDESRLHDLEIKMREKEMQMTDYEEWVSKADSALGKVQDQIKATEKSLGNLKDDYNRLKEQRAHYDQMIREEKMQTQLDKLQEQYNAIDKESQNLASATKVLEKAKVQITKEIDDAGAKLKFSKEEIKSQTQDFEEKTTPLASPDNLKTLIDPTKKATISPVDLTPPELRT